ncbi:MAG TPA: DUF424 family protein [Candidatus Nanoarchaeia archaeon]|nr:DUF424 family protein [Candidatus Nanoarchaeia archaeon]
MIVKIHESKQGDIVAVIDTDLLGKIIEDEDFQLDLTSNFYKGEERATDEIGDLMRNAHGINIVGEKTIALAIEEGLIDEDMVKRIGGIPYYQGSVDIN